MIAIWAFPLTMLTVYLAATTFLGLLVGFGTMAPLAIKFALATVIIVGPCACAVHLLLRQPPAHQDGTTK